MNIAVRYLRKCHIVIRLASEHNKLIAVHLIRIEMLSASSIRIVLICAIPWPELRPRKLAHNIPQDNSLFYRNL